MSFWAWSSASWPAISATGFSAPSISPTRRLHRFQPLAEAVERRLRVARPARRQPRLHRRQPRTDRLDGGVLLGVEPGELPAISATGSSAALDQPRPAPAPPSAAREAVERACGSQFGELASIGASRAQTPRRRRPSGRGVRRVYRRSPPPGSPPPRSARPGPAAASSRSPKRSSAPCGSSSASFASSGASRPTRASMAASFCW